MGVVGAAGQDGSLGVGAGGGVVTGALIGTMPVLVGGVREGGGVFGVVLAGG